MILLKTHYRPSLIILLIIMPLTAGYFLTLPGAPAGAADSDFLLTWSSNSYVPPSYEGKALPSRGSEIKVSAAPLKKISPDPETLYYRWLLDNEIMGQAQGVGRASLEFKSAKWSGDIYKIESQILDGPQGKMVWRGFLNIKMAEPKILMKSASSVYILQDDITASTGDDLILTATPFFFPVEKPSDLNFSWKIDNQIINADDEKKPETLTIEIPNAGLTASIFKKLSLTVQNKIDSLQQSAVNLIIEIK